MPQKLLFSALIFSLLITGCQPKTSETEAEGTAANTEGVVSLSSEEAMAQPLGASFSSANGSFSYALLYDGGFITLMETEDASTPYFEVAGGSTITMQTDLVSTVADVAERAGEPVRVGAYDVYQFMDSEGTCSLDVTLVPYSEEVLRVVLRVCEGNDLDSGKDALKQLLENLVIQAR